MKRLLNSGQLVQYSLYPVVGGGDVAKYQVSSGEGVLSHQPLAYTTKELVA